MKDSKTYRIRTKLGSESDSVINVQLEQTFDTFEILSLKLDQKNAYKLYQSDYGVIVGRVIANGGFGVPNAKVSIFIESEEDEDFTKRLLYPYKSTMATNFDGIRYNLLPDYVDDACHQDVGTFPNKRLVLDNNDIIDIYDKYYVYTTVTNNAGDYMIFGVPTGSQKLHVDLDLSDIGMLSQRPRDLMYKGYKETDFESPNKFKKSTNLNSLAQIYTQDRGVYVYPFWGDTTESKDNIAVTRCDIELSYKFEPTCVFMGSIVTDTGSNSISKNCAGATGSGKMSELVSGEGTIEMIRKTVDNKVESFQIRGNRLIDGDGVWCYQIPMNLDYIMTDEFGNIVPSDNPDKGIPTRTRVRFRISLDKVPNDNTARNRCQYLVPNNPRLDPERYPDYTKTKEVDYEFGTNTKDENYRDLFWNKVYTVKNYIPRLQKNAWVRNRKHTGIKLINHFGDNNPMPYNNMNIKLTFQYRLICVIAKVFINLIRFLNQILTLLSYPFCWIAKLFKKPCKLLRKVPWPLKWITKVLEVPICGLYDLAMKMVFPCIEISSEFCGDNVTHNYSFYPGCGKILFTNATLPEECITEKTKKKHEEQQIKDKVPQEERTEVNFSTGELYNCVESSLAEDNDVVSFNFHNDWVNGVLYAPLWFRKITPKKRLLFGLIKRRAKDQWCSSEMLQNKKLKIFTPCAILREKEKSYNSVDGTPKKAYHMDASMKCGKDMEKQNCLNKRAFIGLHNGIIVKRQTMLGEDVYYYQAAEFDHDQRTGNNAIEGTPVKESGQQGAVKLIFATDIVLLGSLNDCDLQGVPQFYKSLESTTYKMPPTLLFTDNVMITTIDEEGVPQGIFSEDGENITTTQESKTEMTGADWGNFNEDICPGAKKEEHSQDSGLFYSIGCNSQRTLPKSCINLSRICEFGVSLDESKYVLSAQPTENGSDDNFYSYLVPDGFVSKDELYNNDERSAFASLNHNGLHTKLSEKTGLMEYDFDYVFVDNFDNSLRGHMEARQKKCSNSYKFNYWLEEFSDGYYDFRMGKKPYFYDDENYNQNMEKNRQPSGRSLPRYENSFYFYFGLKHGKTALDKFNSQFVSNCYDEDEDLQNIGIIAVGNDWCSDLTQNSRNGYIAIDLSLVDLPCEIIIKSLSDEGFEDKVIETSEEKVYICNWSKSDLDEMHYPSLEGLRQALTELEEQGYVRLKNTVDNHVLKMLPNGTYEMTITDKNGEIITVTFTLKAEYLKSNVVGTNFNYPDNVLLKRFNGNRNAIKIDKTEIIPNPISIISTRDIGGTIAVSFPYNYNKTSGENEEIKYFIIEVLGMKDTNGNYTYNEKIERKGSITKTEGVIAYNENKTNSEMGVALFGVPKPDECFLVKVTEYCYDLALRVYTLSGNTVSYTVCIKEKQPFKLYINEVDYDLISDWHCGFKNTSQNSASVEVAGNPSDNWIHMSDKRRYRWYNYIPYQKLDQEFVRLTEQIHNMFRDSLVTGDGTVDGKTETEFLSQFSGSKYNVLYNNHFNSNIPHVLYNLSEDGEKEDDITKRSKFWQLNTSKLREEIEASTTRPTESVYVSENHVSKDYYSDYYVHKNSCSSISVSVYNTLTPEQQQAYYPLKIDKATYETIDNAVCKAYFSIRAINDDTYNALYDRNMYRYTQTRLITPNGYSSMPDEERINCVWLAEYISYRYTWVTVIDEDEYNELEGYVSDFYVNKNTCVKITPITYNGLDEEEKTQYYGLDVDETTYNSMSSSCKSNYTLKKSRCVQFNEGGKGDYFDLTIDEETYNNDLNDDQRAYFTENTYYVGEETELGVLLSTLYELTEEVDELQDEVVNNVKQTFQLNCPEHSKTIIYRAVTDDKPVTYHEVHKPEKMEEENDFQTVDCVTGFAYSNAYNVDEITVPTITAKDSIYYGDEDRTEPLVFDKFVMSGSNDPNDLVGDMSGNYSYGTVNENLLMFAIDNRSNCDTECRNYPICESMKDSNFVAVNNARYTLNPNKDGNTIPERYKSGGSLGYMFGYHIIDKIFDIKPLVWAITNNIPYFMKVLSSPETPGDPRADTYEGRRIFDNKYVFMNGLFTAQIRNGNAKEYTTYHTDGDRKRANFEEQQIGNVFNAEIYTFRNAGDSDETVEDKIPTLRYITGGDIMVELGDAAEGITNSITIKNYDKYAIGMEKGNSVQDQDMWVHTDNKEYCTLTKYDERYTFKDGNDCELSDNIDSRLRIVLTSDSVNDCKKRENTKFGITLQNCSDEEGLIYYVFDAKDDSHIYFPINKAELEDGNFVMDVGCVGSCDTDYDTRIFEKDVNKLQYLYTVYTKRGLKPYLGSFPFNNIGLQGTLGKYDTTLELESVYENEKTEQEYSAKGWSNTGEFTLVNNNKYPCVYSVAITGNNTRTISPVYDYRYVCVTLIFGAVFTKKEIVDENNAIEGYEFTQNGKMTFDVSNVYDCEHPLDYNKILYYFYNYSYQVSFECKINEANTVKGSYTHTPYVNNPKGYVLFDMSEDGYEELKNIYKNSRGSVGKRINNDTNVELVDVTGLKHIPEWRSSNSCCKGYHYTCWATIIWITNGGVWTKVEGDTRHYLIDDYTDEEDGSNDYYGSSSDFSALFGKGRKYKPSDVGVLTKETGEGSTLCPQEEEGEGGFLGWSTTPDGTDIINADQEITIDCEDENGNGPQIYYAIWADDIVGVKWIDCDGNELKSMCNVIKGAILTTDDMPQSESENVEFVGWYINYDESASVHPEFNGSYEVTGDVEFTAICGASCKPSLRLINCADIGRDHINIVHMLMEVFENTQAAESGTPFKTTSIQWGPERMGSPNNPSLNNEDTYRHAKEYTEGNVVRITITAVELSNGCLIYPEGQCIDQLEGVDSHCRAEITEEFCRSVSVNQPDDIVISRACAGSQGKAVITQNGIDCSCTVMHRVVWKWGYDRNEDNLDNDVIKVDYYVCDHDEIMHPQGITREGCTFNGWQLEDTDEVYDAWETYPNVTSDLTFIALWDCGDEPVTETHTVIFVVNENTVGETITVDNGERVDISDIPEDSAVSALVPEGKVWDNKWQWWSVVNGNFIPMGMSYTRNEIASEVVITADTKFIANLEDEVPITKHNVTFKVRDCQIGIVQEIDDGGHAQCPTSEAVEASECFAEGFDIFNDEWKLEGTNQTYSNTYINNTLPIENDCTFIAVLTTLGECSYDFYWSVPDEVENKNLSGDPITTESLAHGVIPSGSVPTPPDDTPPTLNGFTYGGWLIRGGDGTAFDNNNIPAIMTDTIFDGKWNDTGKRLYKIPYRIENHSDWAMYSGHINLKVDCTSGSIVDSSTNISFGGGFQPGSTFEGNDFTADKFPDDWRSVFADSAVVACQVGNNTVDKTFTRNEGLLVTTTYPRTNPGNQRLVVKLYSTAQTYPVTFNAIDTNGNFIKKISSPDVIIGTKLDSSIIPSESYICSYASPSGVGTAYNFIQWETDPYANVYVWSALTFNAILEKKRYNVTFYWDRDNVTPQTIKVVMVEHGDYATPPSMSEVPVKEGYTFSHWNPDPSTTRITQAGMEFEGVWTPNAPDTVNVTFIAEEQNSSPVVSWTIDTLTNVQIGHVLTQNEVPNEQAILAATGNANAYTFGSWEGGQSPAGVEITASTTSFKAYVNKKTFTVTFKVKDDDSGTIIGSEISAMSVPYGYILSSSDLPSNNEILTATGNPDAYDLDELYWKVGNSTTDFDGGATVEITTNRTVYAMVTKKFFTVKYVHNDGTGNETNVIPSPYYGDVIQIISAPQYADHTFDGWKSSLNNQLYQPGTSYTVQNNVIFTGHWTGITPGPYNVSFYGDNGVFLETQIVQHGSYATPPTIQNDEETTLRRFKEAWIRRSDGVEKSNEWFETNGITDDMDFDAKFVNLFKVRFYTPFSGNQVYIIPRQLDEENGHIDTIPTLNEVNTYTNGTTFMNGWRIGSAGLDAPTIDHNSLSSYIVTGETNFYARFACTVTFVYGAGSSDQAPAPFNVEMRTVLSSSQIPNPTPLPNYTFNGWDNDPTQRILDNTTFTAQWTYEEPQPTGYTVTWFKCDGVTTLRTDTNVPENTIYGTTPGYDYPNGENASTFNGGIGCLFGGEWTKSPITLNSKITSDSTFTPVCSCSGNTYTIKFGVYNNMDSSSQTPQFYQFSVPELNYTLYKGSASTTASTSISQTIGMGDKRTVEINNIDAYSEINLNYITIRYNTGGNDTATLSFNTGIPDEHGYVATIKLYKNDIPYSTTGQNITAANFAQSENGIYMMVVITYEPMMLNSSNPQNNNGEEESE